MDKQLEDLLYYYMFEINDVSTRNIISKEISKIMEYKFTDISDDEIINKGCAMFQGLNPNTNKLTNVIIKPTAIDILE